VVEEKLAARNLEVIPHTVQFHPPLFHYWIHYCALDARTHSTRMFQNLKIGRFHQLIYNVFTLSCTCIYYTFLSRLLLQKRAGKIHHLIHLADMSKGFLFGSWRYWFCFQIRLDWMRGGLFLGSDEYSAGEAIVVSSRTLVLS
jgi:hypothetical protein